MTLAPMYHRLRAEPRSMCAPNCGCAVVCVWGGGWGGFRCQGTQVFRDDEHGYEHATFNSALTPPQGIVSKQCGCSLTNTDTHTRQADGYLAYHEGGGEHVDGQLTERPPGIYIQHALFVCMYGWVEWLGGGGMATCGTRQHRTRQHTTHNCLFVSHRDAEAASQAQTVCTTGHTHMSGSSGSHRRHHTNLYDRQRAAEQQGREAV